MIYYISHIYHILYIIYLLTLINKILNESPINLPRNRRASLPTLSVSSTTSTTAPLLHPSSPAHQFMADIKPQTRSSVIQLNPAYLTQSGREQVSVILKFWKTSQDDFRYVVHTGAFQNWINVWWVMWRGYVTNVTSVLFRIQHNPWRGMVALKGVIQKMKSLMWMSPTKWKLKPYHWHKLKD